MPSLSQTIAEFTTDRASAIPEAVSQHTKRSILDILGLCLAASRTEELRSMRDSLAAFGAPGACTVIGRSDPAASHSAALVNGWLAHVDDYDNTHMESVTHVSAVIVPAALAAAQEAGASGEEFLRAVAMGSEIMIRVGGTARGAIHANGFHTTPVAGSMGASVAASVALRYSARDTQHAMGIAASLASGLLEFVSDGATVKRLHIGWAAHNGIYAAKLAHAGMTGATRALEGRHGLYRAFGGKGIDAAAVIDRLGTTWHLLDSDFKYYPCCHWMHPSIDRVMGLRSAGEISADNVERVTCIIPGGAVPIVAEPRAAKLSPRDGYDARFSLPYCIAAMLVEGRLDLKSFDDIQNMPPAVRDFMLRVDYEADATISAYPKGLHGSARVTLKNGLVIEPGTRADAGPRPAANADPLLEKFRANAAISSVKVDGDRIAARALGLEQLDKVADLARLLALPAR